jgi:hypothetical protein
MVFLVILISPRIVVVRVVPLIAAVPSDRSYMMKFSSMSLTVKTCVLASLSMFSPN